MSSKLHTFDLQACCFSCCYIDLSEKNIDRKYYNRKHFCLNDDDKFCP